MVNGAMGICSLRYVMNLYTMASQDDPRRHSKEVCASESRIKVHKHIKKVACAANVPPFAARPTCMPKPPWDCRGCYGCTGSCTISFVFILPPEKFQQSL